MNVSCWWLSRRGVECDAPLEWVDGWWQCPRGHELRDMSARTRAVIDMRQGTRGLHARVEKEVRG